MNALVDLLDRLPRGDDAAAAAVAERAGSVLRPTGALARLDEIAIHVARWQATTTPAIRSPAVVVFAADHGVAAGGVSAYPTEVTTAMLAAVDAGAATINAMARAVGATVAAVDVGVGRPTGDIRREPALSRGRSDATVRTAIAAIDAAIDAGADVVVLGELGIGNTTVAAAVAAALLPGDPTDWVGRGTGVDGDGLARKRAAVATAVARLAEPDPRDAAPRAAGGTGSALPGSDDPLEVLRQVGGAELIAIAAGCARARQRGVPVVLDGYVATAAVLPLHLARPGALDHCLAGHVSAEPGHRRLLGHLGLTPILDLGMRLGEGSGALAAIPLIAMACAGVTEVPTFDEWFGDEWSGTS